MIKERTLIAFLILSVIALSCSVKAPVVEVTGEKTALEKEVLGTYRDIEMEADTWMMASTRAARGEGDVKISTERKKVFQAIQEQKFNKDDIDEFKQKIGDYLGINYQNTAILIGAGKLGSALAEYPGFEEYGLKIVAIFDSDPRRISQSIGDFTILPIQSLERVAKSFEIGIAIITVPKEAAQSVCDIVVSMGIKAIWNFAPVRLNVPPEVAIRHENLAVGVALLSHYLKQHKQ